jgi:DNA mismatch repair protein MutS
VSETPAQTVADTPLMRQYVQAKQQNPTALLFFRLGDFYELFYEDARVAARELGITLTSRDKERGIPMCGVPYHAAEGYIGRLLRAGFRVAVCEQIADDEAAQPRPEQRSSKKIFRREVTRVLTPGTVADQALQAGENNYLAAVHLAGTRAEPVAALALLDLSTGEFKASEWSGAEAEALCADALMTAQPSEILLAGEGGLLLSGMRGDLWERALTPIRTKTTLDAWVFTREYAVPLLERQMGAHSLEGFGLNNHACAAVAAGAVLHYAQTTQQKALTHIDTLRYLEQTSSLLLDAVSVRNLELIEPLFRGTGADATLAQTLDCCVTPMGKRLLRASVLRPLAEAKPIRARYRAVAELKASLMEREELRRALRAVLDIERLLARVTLETAGPRDLLALGGSLQALPLAARTLGQLQAELWLQLRRRMDESLPVLVALEGATHATIGAEPPVTLAEGGVIAPGVDAELDALRATSGNGRAAIAAIEQRERERTGIGSLKVRFTSVFGYYLEVTRANLKHVPTDYERKQTLVNAERFTTPELKELEHRILTAHERSIEIEKRLFAALRARVLEHSGELRAMSAVIAEVDLLANFAQLAAERDYSEPILLDEADGNCILEVVAGRHAVIEHRMEQRMEGAGGGRFVPNDLSLETGSSSILLITGPNMGGKSTYLRQAALLVILAQMGCFVAARSMRFTLVDRIYTRIGASDNVAHGRSTFMVEMTETATILNTATARSLVLLDEMGRGTATFDGLALAWATLEHIHNSIAARTLFATHYHELTLLAGQLKRLRNVRVQVKETPAGIVFLHAIEPGAANKSYGIDVARLAGVPKSVLVRAREVLRAHERAERRELAAEIAPAEGTAAPMQLTMFTPLSQRIVDRIDDTDVNTLTPLQALNLLQELQQELRAAKANT